MRRKLKPPKAKAKDNDFENYYRGWKKCRKLQKPKIGSKKTKPKNKT